MTTLPASSGHSVTEGLNAFKALRQQDKVKLIKAAGLWSLTKPAKPPKKSPAKRRKTKPGS